MTSDPRHLPSPGAALLGRVEGPLFDAEPDSSSGTFRSISPELMRALAEVKGQAQFLLYLADQIEDSLHQLASEDDPGHSAFLCKVLGMYCTQLETKHQGLGDRIGEACQEVYITVREFDLAPA